MQSAVLPINEIDRLAVLHRSSLLDTEVEKSYDDLVWLTSSICQTPIALVSLVDENRQWFKARVGLDVQETSRDSSFCAHAILRPDEVMVVPDTLLDERFIDNPLVIGDPGIRFYAGAPLNTSDGFSLGSLCVIDRVPRVLTEQQQIALRTLARQASVLIELRRTLSKLHDALGEIKLLKGLLPICSSCKNIRDVEGEWSNMELYIQKHSEAKFSHTICPDCAQRLYPGYYRKK